MSEPQGTKDQSMEEILQSIKRIIADEEAVPQPSGVLELSEPVKKTDKVKGSDILELKDLVEISAEDHLASILGTPNTNVDDDDDQEMQDILGAIDSHFAQQSHVEHIPSPVVNAAPHMSNHTGESDILASIDSLLDTNTVQASTHALQSLKNLGATQAPISAAPHSPLPVGFRSGATVEDLVVEALKPELKQWLNTHLPSIVERMVSTEIKKITGQS
jgi:uncharacterized protein